MDQHWLDTQWMQHSVELGGCGSLGTDMTSAPAQGPTSPGPRAAFLRHHSSPFFAKTFQEFIVSLCMLEGVSEQSFRLKIVGKKTSNRI